MRDKTGRRTRASSTGFIATADGIRLIEYNAPDSEIPKAMNVLSILETDFVDVCLAVVNGTLSDLDVSFAPKATVCKYVVPIKYPAANGASDEIAAQNQSPTIRTPFGRLRIAMMM